MLCLLRQYDVDRPTQLDDQQSPTKHSTLQETQLRRPNQRQWQREGLQR